MRPTLILGAIFLLAMYFGTICLLSSQGDAMTLQIFGHISGHGFQNLTYAGDALNVLITENGTSWNITAEGLV